MEITTDRAFRKHRILGDIYAVEWAVAPDFAREAVAAMQCTKPEQITRGALPVLPIDSGGLDFYTRNVLEFESWEPPMVDEDKLAAIYSAERYCQDTEAEFERCHKAAAAAKKLHEKACDDLRRIVREADRSEPPAPLLAIAERQDTDDATENEPNDDRNDGAASDDQHPD